jgi:hypothetical protein
MYAEGITLGPDGSVFVYDPRRATISIFEPDGVFVSAFRRPRGGSITPWPGRVLSDGTVVDWLFSLPDRVRERPMAVGRRSVVQPIRLFPGELPDQLRVDTLAAITHVHETVGPIRIPFSAKLAFSSDPNGGVWFSHETEYKFFHRGLGGDTLLVVTLEGDDADPLSEQEVDSLVRGIRVAAESHSSFPLSLPGPNDLPSYRPVVTRIITDDAGHVLVFPRLQRIQEGRIMDVFGAKTGEYLGRVSLPIPVTDQTPAFAGEGALYLVETTSLGVHRVVRLALLSQAQY